ncbi:MAG: hypothetical protein RL154_776, partial [Pseudomonadota bacterium]
RQMSSTDNILEIAKIGKPVGLAGDLKLHLFTDFPKQFKKGKVFLTATNKSLKITSFNENRLVVRFEGYNSPEEASLLTNQVLLSTIEDSKQSCALAKDEYFWFDIIGCNIVENDEVIGLIEEIDRFGGGDFLRITTSQNLIAQKLPQTFILPFKDPFVVSVDIESKSIFTKGAKDILEAS